MSVANQVANGQGQKRRRATALQNLSETPPPRYSRERPGLRRPSAALPVFRANFPDYFRGFFARAEEAVFVLADAVFTVLDFVRVWLAPGAVAFAPLAAFDLGAVFS